MKKHYRHEHNCLNCGTHLQGKFCHNCGQENLEIKESFGHMVNHAVSDYFHFDHQFFHTLRPLFLKPGKLTNEYMAGKRAQYLHPIKMYIFISLVYFLLLFKSTGHKTDTAKVEQKQLTTEQKNKLKKEISENVVANNPILSEKQKKNIVNKIDEVPVKGDTLKKTTEAVKSVDTKSGHDDEDDETSALNFTDFKTYEEYLASEQKLPTDERDGFLTRYAIKKSFDWNKKARTREEAIEIFVESIKHNTPKMMFVLLPLFALLLKIAFYRNHKFYVEHLIYTIHLHCYLFLFLTVLMLLGLVLPEGMHGVLKFIKFVSVLTIIWYIYRSLRVVYNRSRFRTVTKMIGIGLSYTFVISMALVVLIALTAVTAA